MFAVETSETYFSGVPKSFPSTIAHFGPSAELSCSVSHSTTCSIMEDGAGGTVLTKAESNSKTDDVDDNKGPKCVKCLESFSVSGDKKFLLRKSISEGDKLVVPKFTHVNCTKKVKTFNADYIIKHMEGLSDLSESDKTLLISLIEAKFGKKDRNENVVESTPRKSQRKTKEDKTGANVLDDIQAEDEVKEPARSDSENVLVEGEAQIKSDSINVESTVSDTLGTANATDTDAGAVSDVYCDNEADEIDNQNDAGSL